MVYKLKLSNAKYKDFPSIINQNTLVELRKYIGKILKVKHKNVMITTKKVMEMNKLMKKFIDEVIKLKTDLQAELNKKFCDSAKY